MKTSKLNKIRNLYNHGHSIYQIAVMLRLTDLQVENAIIETSQYIKN